MQDFKSDIVLVHGDTTTSKAAAMAPFYPGTKWGHVEAGLRARNLFSLWPEGANRQITGRLASYHFVPTQLSREKLLNEVVADSDIFVTGNTVIDALFMVKESIEQDRELDGKLASNFNFLDESKKLILVTGYRRENHGGGIERVSETLAKISERGDNQILYPIHLKPKVRDAVYKALRGIENVILIEPQADLPLAWLLNKSHIVVTDSGDVLEEAPSFGKPVFVTRDTTERPDALDAGTVRLVDTAPDLLVKEDCELLDNQSACQTMARARKPYGDGKAASRIANVPTAVE